ncbi:MAG TPA: gamma-glutamyl-gamma-aminobutyrate hydrolase family protein [Mycobacterium sp.]
MNACESDGGDPLRPATPRLRSPRASRPVVGLTSYLERVRTGIWDIPAGYLPADYFEGVISAGGIAVLLPPQPVDPDIVSSVLDSLHALVVTGGYDLDPAAYGQQPHPTTDQPRGDRDAWEFALLRGALDRGLPVLGICRGAQVLNVAFGGTLHQNLPDVLGHSGHRAGNGVFTRLRVQTVAGTRLAALLGQSADAPCYHHQAIDKVGDGLVVSAWDPDGVVEALELPGDNFVLAVQWHPEQALEDSRLFTAIVDAARSYAQRAG